MAKQTFSYKERKERKPNQQVPVGKINYKIPAKSLCPRPGYREYEFSKYGEIYLTVNCGRNDEQNDFEIDLIIPTSEIDTKILESLVKRDGIEVDFPNNTVDDNYIGPTRVNFFQGRGFPLLPAYFKEVIVEKVEEILYDSKNS